MSKIGEANALERDRFAQTYGGVLEHSAWLVARVADKRPFRDSTDFLAALRDAITRASDEEKLQLIRAHPDLVGRAVLTPESQHEQRSAGLGELSPDEIGRFRKYNGEYRDKFGFPFVICARLNKKEAILQAFPARLRNTREQEIETALGEICKIASLRLQDLLQ